MNPNQQTSYGNALEGRYTHSLSAIIFGVTISVASYLLVMLLGAGLGFSILSPWNLRNHSAETLSLAAVSWVILAQLISSGGGGYIAGRLVSTQPESNQREIRFRQTVYGLMVWALASVAVVVLLSTAVSTMLAGAVSTVTSIGKGIGAASGTAYLAHAAHIHTTHDDNSNSSQDMSHTEDSGGIDRYVLDYLLRPLPDVSADDQHSAAQNSGDRNVQRLEIARIFANAIQENGMPESDKKYVAQIVSARTGMSKADALARVNETLDRSLNNLEKANSHIKEALENTRQAGVKAALWSFLALLCGALSAALAARYAGIRSQRS